MAKLEVSVSYGDAKRIHGYLEKAGILDYSSSLINKVISGDRDHPEILEVAMKYYREKARMERRFLKWLEGDSQKTKDTF